MLAVDAREVVHRPTTKRALVGGLGPAVLLALSSPGWGQEIVKPPEFWLLRPQPVLPMPQTMAPMNVQPLLLPPMQRPANNPQGMVLPNQMPQYMQPQGWWTQNNAFDMSAYKNTPRPDLSGGQGGSGYASPTGGRGAASGPTRRQPLGW